MEKAITKLKFEIGVLEGLKSQNVEINERIISYKKAVKVLEKYSAKEAIKLRKISVQFMHEGKPQIAEFDYGTTDEEIVEYFEGLLGVSVKWCKLK